MELLVIGFIIGVAAGVSAACIGVLAVALILGAG